jgi:DNA repair protein RadC
LPGVFPREEAGIGDYTVGIKELAAADRPRERLIRYGAQSLSPAELLAIVLRTGARGRSAIDLAAQLLAEHQGFRGIAGASIEELAKVKGIGSAKAAQIAACVELGRRLGREAGEDQIRVARPEDAYYFLRASMRDWREERFVALLLNTKGILIRDVTVSVGSLDSSIVHPREVFRAAVTASAASVILAHNHPSGDPAPSAEDVRVTKRLSEAGILMGIEVLDHLIIGDDRWVSLKQQGLL